MFCWCLYWNKQFAGNRWTRKQSGLAYEKTLGIASVQALYWCYQVIIRVVIADWKLDCQVSKGLHHKSLDGITYSKSFVHTCDTGDYWYPYLFSITEYGFKQILNQGVSHNLEAPITSCGVAGLHHQLAPRVWDSTCYHSSNADWYHITDICNICCNLKLFILY